MIIKVNGISLNYSVADDKGKWLTMLHGAQDNLDVWWNQIPVLSKKYRVLTLDWRGHGDTETPAVDHPFELLVKDLYELWKALGIKETYLLGHSMGGGIVVRAALAHPEIVKALIMTNSGVSRKQSSNEENEQLMQMRRQRWDHIEKYGFWPYPDNQKLTPAEQKYKEMKMRNDPRKYVRMIRTLDRSGPPPDTSNMNMPTLIISGELDDLGGPSSGKVTQSLIAGSKLVVLPTGHTPHIEQPDMFNKTLIDFLDGLPD